jgi:hypothetical protein
VTMLFSPFFPVAGAEPTPEPGIISPEFEIVEGNPVDLATTRPHVDYTEVETSSEVETKVSPPEGTERARTCVVDLELYLDTDPSPN